MEPGTLFLFKDHLIKDRQEPGLPCHKQSALYLSEVPRASVDPHILVCVQISLRQDPGNPGTLHLDRAFLQFCSSEVKASESTHSPSFWAHTPKVWNLTKLLWAHCANVSPAGITLHHWINLQLVQEAGIFFSWDAAIHGWKKQESSWAGNSVFQMDLRKTTVLSQKEFTNWNHYLATISLLFVFKEVPLGLSVSFTHHSSTLFQT